MLCQPLILCSKSVAPDLHPKMERRLKQIRALGIKKKL
jgi:hypothetical protein